VFYGLPKIISSLITYRYAVVFPIAVIEGPLVSIIAGSLAAQGYFNVYAIYGLLVLADLVGDTLYYCAGRYGGLYFIKKWHGFFNTEPKEVLFFEPLFLRQAPKLLFFGKLQGLGSVVLMAAGIVKYPYGLFMWYNAIATFIKSAVLVTVGYVFYHQLSGVDSAVTRIGIILSVIFIGIVAWVFIRKARNERDDVIDFNNPS
jgi:membrane protein DedA with SNARE-associated domain